MPGSLAAAAAVAILRPGAMAAVGARAAWTAVAVVVTARPGAEDVGAHVVQKWPRAAAAAGGEERR